MIPKTSGIIVNIKSHTQKKRKHILIMKGTEQEKTTNLYFSDICSNFLANIQYSSFNFAMNAFWEVSNESNSFTRNCKIIKLEIYFAMT